MRLFRRFRDEVQPGPGPFDRGSPPAAPIRTVGPYPPRYQPNPVLELSACPSWQRLVAGLDALLGRRKPALRAGGRFPGLSTF